MARPGPMRHRVRIEQRSSSVDTAGEQLTSWSLVGERFAEKVETPGEEFWSGRERSGRIPTVFKIRFPKDFAVKPQMRLVHASKLYDIISAIDPTGLEVDMLITCEELIDEPTA